MTNSQNDDPRSAFANAKKLTGNGICGQFFCISKYEFEGFQGFDTPLMCKSRHFAFANANARCVSRP
eukprot:COSAG02_NODE_625_length_19372_cov_14.475355_16_plen_67_part_00